MKIFISESILIRTIGKKLISTSISTWSLLKISISISVSISISTREFGKISQLIKYCINWNLASRTGLFQPLIAYAVTYVSDGAICLMFFVCFFAKGKGSKTPFTESIC